MTSSSARKWKPCKICEQKTQNANELCSKHMIMKAVSRAKCDLCYRSHLPEFHDNLANLTHAQDVLVQFADLLQNYAKQHEGMVTATYIDEVLQIVISAGKMGNN
jgi:hypothetical protein